MTVDNQGIEYHLGMDDQQQESRPEDGMEDVLPEDANEPYPPDPEDLEDIDAPGQHVPVLRSQRVKRPLHNAAKGGKAQKARKGRVDRKGNRILSQQKRRQALELRKAGATYRQIADTVGYHDAPAAHKAVMKAFGEVIQEPVNDLKTIQIERLNHMLVVLWPKVQGGDERAIGTALMVMNKIDSLMGTDAAQRVEVKSENAVLVVDGNKDDYIAALKRMSGAGIGPDGKNLNVPTPNSPQALPTTRNYPPGMGGSAPLLTAESDTEEIVEAEVIDDIEAHAMDSTVPVENTNPSVGTKKKFSFGVDPTVSRD